MSFRFVLINGAKIPLLEIDNICDQEIHFLPIPSIPNPLQISEQRDNIKNRLRFRSDTEIITLLNDLYYTLNLLSHKDVAERP